MLLQKDIVFFATELFLAPYLLLILYGTFLGSTLSWMDLKKVLLGYQEVNSNSLSQLEELTQLAQLIGPIYKWLNWGYLNEIVPKARHLIHGIT